MIIDFRPLNAFCEDLSVKYDSIDDVKLAFAQKRASYLASFDVKDGYHHFGIARAFRHFFQFVVNGEYYEANTLPFGWN